MLTFSTTKISIPLWDYWNFVDAEPYPEVIHYFNPTLGLLEPIWNSRVELIRGKISIPLWDYWNLGFPQDGLPVSTTFQSHSGTIGTKTYLLGLSNEKGISIPLWDYWNGEIQCKCYTFITFQSHSGTIGTKIWEFLKERLQISIPLWDYWNPQA